MPSACVLIPVKRFALAKSRLAATLGPQERRALVSTMVRRVLDSVAPAVSGVAVPWSAALVTEEPDVIELANERGIAVLAEPRARTLEAALAVGIETLTRLGFERLAFVPGDVPQMTTADVHTLLGAGDSTAVRIVAAKRDGALNAVSWPAKYALTLEFGPGSAARVADRVEKDGLHVERLRAPRLALDIDTPQDLSEWLANPPERTAWGTL
jgi:2-phospho-L-lactate/phosphoenolpyruvate guanylyltransferase